MNKKHGADMHRAFLLKKCCRKCTILCSIKRKITFFRKNMSFSLEHNYFLYNFAPGIIVN